MWQLCRISKINRGLLFPFELNVMKAAVYFCDLNTIISANAPDKNTDYTRATKWFRSKYKWTEERERKDEFTESLCYRQTHDTADRVSPRWEKC